MRRAGGALIGGLAAVAIAAPLVIAAVRAPDPTGPTVATVILPDVIAREQVRGRLTIVEFIDFECPHCRRMHGRLAAALAQVDRPDRPVRLVRKMVPLRAHPHALPAALAWCGADAQGQGDAMADALIAADPSALTPAGCERIAEELGLDLVAYRAVCTAPATRARIDADTAAAKAAGVRMLPTIYVGSIAFAGAGASEAELVAALRSS